MPISLYTSGIEMQPLDSTMVEELMIKPYQNRSWDGEYAIFYHPPQDVTDQLVLTIHGNVAHFSYHIFSGYYEKASVELRRFFTNVLHEFHPNPIIKTENLPAFARVFVTEQPGRRMVHVLLYLPEMRGKTLIIEEGIELRNIIMLRNENATINHVYLAIERQNLSFQYRDGYTEVIIPQSCGYSLIVFEKK